MRDAIYDPELDFLRILNRIFPAIRLFDTDTEDADDRFFAERRAVFFAVFAVRPGRHQSASRLTIRE